MTQVPSFIILADDDEGDRQLFIEAFDELKIKTTIHTVNDGVELMEYLANSKTQLPLLIFLDLNMPRKNGMACLREIRNTEKFKEIFIAIYSTSDFEKEMEKAFQEGANVYIKKPNDFHLLKEAINKAVTAALQYQDPPFKKSNFMLRI